MMRVELELGEELQAEPPRALFPMPKGMVGESWEVSADGERYFFLEEVGESVPVTVTGGWREALARSDRR